MPEEEEEEEDVLALGSERHEEVLCRPESVFSSTTPVGGTISLALHGQP